MAGNRTTTVVSCSNNFLKFFLDQKEKKVCPEFAVEFQNNISWQVKKTNNDSIDAFELQSHGNYVKLEIMLQG